MGSRQQCSTREEPSLNQRKERTARKLDRTAALEQHARGLSTTEISRLQGVNPSTVWRFLDRSEPHRVALEEFKRGRGNEFAALQAKSMALQHKILDTFDDGILAAMTTHQKTGLVSVLSAQTGTMFDKERLETGKSTTNVSLISRMMGEAVKTAHEPGADPGPDEERP
jgi:DNA-binding IclR family transcriptional regulator